MADAPVTGADNALGRLRTLIIADAMLTVGGAAFTIGVHLLIDTTPWLFRIGLFVALMALTMLLGLRPLRRGDIDGALAWLCGANWASAVVVSAVATFSWPLMVQAALLPAAFAGSFVPRNRITRYGITSFVAAVAAAALGLLQDFSGLSADVPSWSRTSVLLFFTPLISGLVVFVALQNNFRLQSAIAEVLLTQVALADRAEELARSRARVVAATDRERRRIERDLHDGAQSRLVAINLRLAHARSRLRDDPDEAERTLELLRNELHQAQSELRNLAHGVYPTTLTRHGLAPAVQAAADNSPVPVELSIGDIGRHPIEIESTFYFCILEALQNAVKHSRADRVRIAVDRTPGSGGRVDRLRFEVSDTGVGFEADTDGGVGLQNLRDRLGAIGGDLTVSSTPGRGTTVTGDVILEHPPSIS